MAGGSPSDAALFEHAACGLLLARPDGVIVRVNATLCAWLGQDAQDLVGAKKLQELFSIGGRVFHQTHCLPMLQVQGSVAEVQVDLLHRDRRRIPTLMNIARRAHDGVLFDEVAFFVTIDRRSYERELLLARQEAESALEARRGAEAQLLTLNEQLSRDDRRKDEFLATLAHELRNPMAPIRNAIELLKLQHQRTASPLPSRPLIVLERQVTHMAHLVDDLMEISRITQGHVELRCLPVGLAAAMQAAADDAMPMIAAAGHTLALMQPPASLTIHADATRLMQVILNLLTNAAKYTPRGGVIELSAWREGDDAVIAVRDNGIGIPPESLGTIFQMFSQLTPALERAQGGLGIGLALVRGLVELHGGSIIAASAGVGQGSTFTVRLPALPEAAPLSVLAATMDRREAPAEATGRRILVVDDNLDATDTMCEMLELFGYETRAAGDGASALAAAAAFQPQMVLLDIGLPDMNGYEVARRLRLAPGGECLFLVAATGWGQQDDRARALAAGFDRHLTKPIDVAQLRILLEQGAGGR